MRFESVDRLFLGSKKYLKALKLLVFSKNCWYLFVPLKSDSKKFCFRKDTEVWAVCDILESRRQDAVEVCGPEIKQFADYEDLLNSGIDAVVLCNYLPDHASAAIRAMEKGIHVLSECADAPICPERIM